MKILEFTGPYGQFLALQLNNLPSSLSASSREITKFKSSLQLEESSATPKQA